MDLPRTILRILQTEPLIAVLSIVAFAALVAALAVLAVRWRGVNRLIRGLVGVLALLLAATAFSDVLEWMDVYPQADLAENFLEPLIPAFWLFLFIVQLEHEDRRRVQDLNARLVAVHDLATRLTAKTDSSALLQEAVDHVAALFEAPYAALFLMDHSEGKLRARATHGLTEAETRQFALEPGEGISGRAFAEGRPLRCPTPATIASGVGAQIVRRYRITNVAAVPLTSDGRTIGVLSAVRSSGTPFTEDDLAVLATLGAHACAALKNTALYEKVAESEAKLRTLVENAEVAIVVVDEDRHIILWNHGAEKLYGWSREEVAGRHISLIYPEEKRDDVPHDILPALRHKGAWFGEYPAVRKDGTRFTAWMNLSRVFDAAGRAVCTLGIVMDVTERVQLRAMLVQAQKMETVGMLAGGIAHDFSNLLTGILGFAGLLKGSLEAGTEGQDAARQIEEAAQRGVDLVRRLMAFSHRHPIKPQPVNLNDIVDEVTRLLERTFTRHVEVETDLDRDLHLVRADAAQIHQVLMNLTVNARDAMPKGGTLTLATRNAALDTTDAQALGLEPGPYVRLTVRDTGEGMDEEVQACIFEPFFTTKPAETGTGLGLATVLAIVSRNGGRINCESRPGEGTTFTVLLPALPLEGVASEGSQAGGVDPLS